MDHSFSHHLQPDNQDLGDGKRNKYKTTLIASAFMICKIISFKNS
jgi:hypothetical protein